MLYWLPTRRTRPDVPARRDDRRWWHTDPYSDRHTDAYSDRHTHAYTDGDAHSHCDGNAQPHRDSDGDAQCHRHAKCNGNPDSGTGSLYIV